MIETIRNILLRNCCPKDCQVFQNTFVDFFIALQLNISRHVTRGGMRGEVSPALFENLKKSALNLGKNAQARFFYGINFSFKMLF